MDQLVDFLFHLPGPLPYLLVFGVLIACGLGVPLPEDIILITGGLGCYYGLMDVGLTIAISMVGVLGGDSIIFFLGHKYGRALTKKWIFHKLLPDERLAEVRRRFHKRGNALIFTARFLPGLRAPIFFSAGTLHLPYRVFLLYDGLAALISVPAIVGLVYYFGDEIDWIIRQIQRVEHGIALAIACLGAAFLAKRYLKNRHARISARRRVSS
jgi:membrane protein DedA with SNARE-associated domain